MDIICPCCVVSSMQKWGRKYPKAGYGKRFKKWINDEDPKPNNSYANGAAMRISPVGYLYNSLDRALEVAKYVTEVTHDHPEAVAGAQAVAGSIAEAYYGYLGEKDPVRKKMCDILPNDLRSVAEKFELMQTASWMKGSLLSML